MPGRLAGPWRARQDHRAVRGGFAAALLPTSAASRTAAPSSPAGLRAPGAAQPTQPGAAQPALSGERPALQEAEVVLPWRAVRFRRLSAARALDWTPAEEVLAEGNLPTWPTPST